ncbi:hypothetical protein [Yoonia sp. 208BN28-4]|uniref:hypothetical protein n=1 Tax=Yoonia sp. 208BN28-4 TaxID=3126505 RepID=UPI0030A18A01
MSKGYRDGAFALGIVVGCGIAFNLFLWLDYRAKYKGDQPANGNGDTSSSEIGNYWDRLIGTFVSPSDTLAQWIMAAFTIAVVVLVWRTLIATQNIATDTRKIGEAQVRAYMTYDDIEIIWENKINGPPEPNFAVVWRNTGNSPARNVRQSIFFISEKGPRFRGSIMSLQDMRENLAAFGKIVGPQKTTVSPIRGTVPTRLVADWVDEKTTFILTGLIEWDDIFGTRLYSQYTAVLIADDRVTNKVRWRIYPTGNEHGLREKG